MSAEAHVGRHPTELLPELQDLGSLLAGWRRVLETGEPMVAVEGTGATPDDTTTEGHWNEIFFPIRVGQAIVGTGGTEEDTAARWRHSGHTELKVCAFTHRVKQKH